MPEVQSSKVSPIVAIAAVAVVIFSAVGVGVLTGFIPNSLSKSGEKAAPPEAPPPVAAPAPVSAPAPVEAPKAVASTPTKKKPAAQPAREPARVASAEPAPRVAAPEPPKAAPKICRNCGSVISVNAVKQQGEGSGLGVVAGGVVGGLLGNQVGRGRGRTAATVVGAGAGAFAGNEIEKHAKSTETFNVAVRMDDGSSRTFTYPSEPVFRSGDKVKIVRGELVAR